MIFLSLLFLPGKTQPKLKPTLSILYLYTCSWIWLEQNNYVDFKFLATMIYKESNAKKLVFILMHFNNSIYLCKYYH